MDNQIVLLLTVRFSRADDEQTKPLSNREWHRLHEWMTFQNIASNELLRNEPSVVLQGWDDTVITIERIEGLLGCKPALALAMEKWSRVGVWTKTILEDDYPAILKERLGCDAPTLMFGCGDPKRLLDRGLSVVGSRNTSDDVLRYARRLGEMATERGIQIVSGGARGVDQSAMLGALDSGGSSLGILADSLLRAVSGKVFREHLMRGRLTLVSPFSPEAGFNAGNAMQRNKLIYCLSDVGFAVQSGTKGGTWSGVHEAIRKRWIPVWVRRSDDPEAGNNELISAGAIEAPNTIDDLDFDTLMSAQLQPDLFDLMGV